MSIDARERLDRIIAASKTEVRIEWCRGFGGTVMSIVATDIRQQKSRRQEQAIEIAVRGSKILKARFGVSKVVLFGSMLDADRIDADSDIDIAVWGLNSSSFLSAGCAIDDIIYQLGYDFPPVDLVDVEMAKTHILEAIKVEGVEI